MQNLGGSIFNELKLIVGTPVSSAQFIVETANAEIQSGTVTSESPVTVDIPFLLDLQVINFDGENRHKGIRIYSQTDEPIFVLGATSVAFFNYGTFLAYPCPLELDLGTFEYLIMSVETVHLYSQFLLVGCSNDTLITIVPSQDVEIPADTQNPASSVSIIQKGTEHTITLHQLNTLLIFSDTGDLSGTRIVSNKPLTVIGGHECANVPLNSHDCEPIAVQIPPVATWGTSFLVAGYAGRTTTDLQFSIVPSEQNTTMDVSCGDWKRSVPQTPQYAVPSGTVTPFCLFEFSKPVFFAQLASGGSIDNLGDPAISIISPTDQYINNIEFIVLSKLDFPTSYISIMVPAEHYDPTSILLDGTMLNCEWMAINNRSNDIVGYGCNVTMPAQSSTTPTQHTLSHSDPSGRISATVYGFRDFPAQGYAYLTGQKLEITNLENTGITKLGINNNINLPHINLPVLDMKQNFTAEL